MNQENQNHSDELTLANLQQGFEKLGHSEAISTSENFLMLSPPGIYLKDIRTFLATLLAEIGDSWDVIPDTLPVDGLCLSSFLFSPKTTTEEHGITPFQLEFTIDWMSAQWEVIPGVLKLASPSLTLYVTGKANSWDKVRTSATVAGLIELEKLPVYVNLELPNGSFSAQLLHQGDKEAPSPSSLFQKFQVSSPAERGTDDQGIDLGALTLSDLTVLGSVRARHLLFHLAISDIELGPGYLSPQFTLDYFGGTGSQISGQIWGNYDVFKKGYNRTGNEEEDNKNKILSLMLLAAYDGPGKSWKFEGEAASKQSIKELIGIFTEDTDGIPGVFDQLKLKYLHLACETGSGNFDFQCDVEVEDLFGAGAAVEVIVAVHLHKVGQENGAQAKYAKTFGGQLLFKLEDGTVLEFDLLFDQTPTGKSSDTTFIAAYKNPSGGKIDIGDLIRQIEPEIDVPLCIKLNDAFFIYDKQSAVNGNSEKSNSLFGLDIGGGIDLAALPLVGKILPKEASLHFGLQPRVAFGTKPFFSEEDLSRLSGLIPGGNISLPTRAINEQIGLGVNISLGTDTSFHFDLPIQLNSKVQPKPDKSGQNNTPNPDIEEAIETTESASEEPPTSPATAGTTPAPSGSSASGIQWIKVGKDYGPVSFNRIGLQFESNEKKVWAYLDASLGVGGLRFTLNGLGMGTPINKLEPEFRLLGIGIDYEAGPVKIGAAFLRNQVEKKIGEETVKYDEYSGLASIQTPTVGLAAIGSYSDLPNYKSLFIYAVLHAPIGGPSFFFVTGLAAGFGYNRAIRTPDVALVGQFPLINLAVEGAGSPIPEGVDGRADYIHDILDQLRDSVYPEQGHYFLAAGVRFSSFQLIDSFALLIVQFDKELEFEIDVLGLSTVIVPTPLPGGPKVSPIAELQLALKATFKPAEGELKIDAQLTDNSFVLDRDCRLTGGFAFYSWFAGPHQGDFILTLGGYHPDFKKPAHYPSVPRLGLNWPVTSELSIKGGIYFALCSHMLMAGGKLEATYKSGSLKAWFTLGVDFLIAWKPYHYDARAYLDIGVEYTYHFWGTRHINTHVNAEVHVWGPEFAGHAHVELWCVTFDINFGAKTTPKLDPISWSEFQQSFLPADTGQYATLSVMGGLLRKQKVGETELHIINPRDFKLGVDLVVPFKTLKIEGQELPVQEVYTTTVKGAPEVVALTQQDGTFSQRGALSSSVTAGLFGIAPMGYSADQVQSDFTFKVIKEGVDCSEDFAFRPVLKRLPRALWGVKMKQDLNGERYVENVLAGLEIFPAQPPQPGVTQWVAKKNLQYSTAHVEPGVAFEPITAFVADEVGESITIDLIKQNLTDPTTMENRRQLLHTLGFDYDRLGIELSPDIANSLVMEPQFGHLV